MTLTEFLLARIAEAELRAQRMDEHYAPFEQEWNWCPRALNNPLGDLRWGPDAPCECNCPELKRRALAECEAKRQIAAALGDYEDGYVWVWTTAESIRADIAPCALASVDADHPDFQEKWKL